MGRPHANKSDDFTIGHDQTIQHLTQVELPNFKRITYQEKIGKFNDGKPIYGTTDYVSNRPTPKGMKVVKSKAHTMRLVNICPNCHKEGRPRMAKRPNKWDYHVYLEPDMVKSENDIIKRPTGRRDSYFLVYDHKIDGKKITHSIVRFDENHGFFTKRGKLSDKLKEVMFPFCVTALKNT